MNRTISNDDDTIDSRDVIRHFEELYNIKMEIKELEEKDEPLTDQERVDLDGWIDKFDEDEYELFASLCDQGEAAPDWVHGETMINADYFVEYTEQLIKDCFELPAEFNSSEWPWRHMTIDYEAAAEELEQDYIEVDFDGVTFFIRA